MNGDFFFDTPSVCHKNMYTYLENILDGRKMDKDILENVAWYYFLKIKMCQNMIKYWLYLNAVYLGFIL